MRKLAAVDSKVVVNRVAITRNRPAFSHNDTQWRAIPGCRAEERRIIRVINDSITEYYCIKRCKGFVPEGSFTPSNIRMRKRVCRDCTRSCRKPQQFSKIERLRLSLVQFLRNHGFTDAPVLVTHKLVYKVLEANGINTEKAEDHKHIRIYPPNNGNLDAFEQYHVVIFDKYVKT